MQTGRTRPDRVVRYFSSSTAFRAVFSTQARAAKNARTNPSNSPMNFSKDSNRLGRPSNPLSFGSIFGLGVGSVAIRKNLTSRLPEEPEVNCAVCTQFLAALLTAGIRAGTDGRALHTDSSTLVWPR